MEKCFVCNQKIINDFGTEYNEIHFHKFCWSHAVDSNTLRNNGTFDNDKLPILKEYILLYPKNKKQYDRLEELTKLLYNKKR